MKGWRDIQQQAVRGIASRIINKHPKTCAKAESCPPQLTIATIESRYSLPKASGQFRGSSQ